MAYLNDYNVKIANEIYQRDKALIDHLDMEAVEPMNYKGGNYGYVNGFDQMLKQNNPNYGNGMSGGKMYIQDKYIEDVLRGGCMNCGCQPNFNSRQIGGTGYGKATWKDAGFGQELGLGTVETFKPSSNSKGGVKEMKKEDSKICYVGVGSGVNELKEDLGKFDFNKIKDWIGLGKKLKMSGKGWEELRKDLKQYDINRIKEYIGLGKYGKANSKRMMGEGFWDDFRRGFNMVFEPASKYLLKPLGLLTGNAPAVAGLTALGYAKPKRGRKSKMGAGMNTLMPVKDRAVPPKELMLQTDDIFGSGVNELKEDLGKFDFNRLKSWIGLAKPKELMAFKKHIKMSGKGWDDFKKDLGSFDFNRIKDYIGLGKYGKANSKRMMGEGWLGSIANFFTKTLPDVVGLGKGMSGGKVKKEPSAKQLQARANFVKMVRAKALLKKNNK